jgi:hypothetical protein
MRNHDYLTLKKISKSLINQMTVHKKANETLINNFIANP